MEIAIMIEGQDGINWQNWRQIAWTVEEAGFAGLHRSDHFTNPNGPVKDALDLWPSLTWLATETDDLDFGPLVTPCSFRDPVFTARMAKDVQTLSGGRLILGLGAGWQEREHDMFGYPLLKGDGRFDRFEESLKVILPLLQSDEPVSFEGDYYTLQAAELLPRPEPGPPAILIGGNGMNRTLPLTARYADWWNGVFLTPEGFAERTARLDALLAEEGREPGDVRRTLMTGLRFGRTEGELRDRLGGADVGALRDRGVIVGTPLTVPEQLRELEDAGCERVMLQWLDLEHIDWIRDLAEVTVG